MKIKTGKEMKSLIIALSLTMLLLVAAVIAFFMVDSILTANENIKHNKQKVVEQAIQMLQQISGSVSNVGADVGIIKYFNPEIPKEVLSGDTSTFYTMVAELAISLYPIDYFGLIQNGKIFQADSKPGLEVESATIPLDDLDKDYFTLDSLGNRQGFFIGVPFNTNLKMYGLGTLRGVVIFDRTAELADIEKFFNDQKNSLVLGMTVASIIALILTVLLTTLGLRHFTKKYVMQPIDELNRTAEEIIAGTFEGDVVVDEESAYARLQGLLESGQKVLRQVDKKMLEEEGD